MPLLADAPCPLCQSLASAVWVSQPAGDLTHEGWCKTRICQACGGGFTVAGHAQDGHVDQPDAPGRSAEWVLRGFFAERCRKVGRRHRAGRLVDVGCGTGGFLQTMREAGWQVMGVEPSTPLARIAAARLGARAIRRGLEDLVAAGETADVITFWHALEHIDDVHGILETTWALLGADGGIFICVPDRGSWQARVGGARWAYFDAPRHRYHFTLSALTQLLERHRFRVMHRYCWSWEYDIFGWWQTLLNRLGGAHNFMYYQLKKDGYPKALSVWRWGSSRAIGLVAGPVVLLVAALCAALERLLTGRGAVIEVYAVPAGGAG